MTSVGRAAVLGSPIGHSLSPVLHRAAYRELGLTGWSYEAIECDEAGLPALLASLGPKWAGLSLTMPLKRAVLPLLDAADPLVGQVGAANTVVFADGSRRGYNTDVPGMVAALQEAGLTVGGVAGREALILGGGATACAALAAVQRIGARRAVVAVRNESTAGPLLDVAGRLDLQVRLIPFAAGSAPVGVRLVAPQRPRSHTHDEGAGLDRLAGWPLLISTVPAGAADVFADQISMGSLTADTVLDVVYHPWPTRLAAAARAAGSAVVSGFELLLHQAAGQVELMTGRTAPVSAMRAAGQAELDRRASQAGGTAGLPVPACAFIPSS